MAAPAITKAFYDLLAGRYEYLFDDYESERDNQGTVISGILSRLGYGGDCVFDLASGIGTQSIPLSQRNWCVHASDFSGAAIARQIVISEDLGLCMDISVQDLTNNLIQPHGESYSVLLLMGNSLAFLLDDNQVAASFGDLRGRLRARAIIGSTRDYLAVETSNVFETSQIFSDDRGTREVGHRWHWTNDDRYEIELSVHGDGVSLSGSTTAKARSRDTISGLLQRCGWDNTVWYEPCETGYYQPIFVAR
jgi:glycine/sarcosine N-methyltransferase